MNRPLPEDFILLARTAMGDDRFARFMAALDEEPPVSIRLNPLKAKGMLAKGGVRVAWCDEGYYLPARPNFTFDPLLHAGCYYVQEAASMFISHVVRQLITEPVAMLDLCAAPGGKSTALLASLPEGSRLVSNEPVRQRFQVLSENLAKWGYPNHTATNRYPRDFRRDGHSYDAILCDVPCSGEGMFRKDENAISEWSPQHVDECSRLQRTIIADVWSSLKPGGLLFYSTCTFNARENEDNVAWIVEEFGAKLVDVKVEEAWNITGALAHQGPVYRFIPGLTQGEGLFMAVLRKPGKPADDAPQHPAKQKDAARKLATNWILNPEDYTLYEKQDTLTAIPRRWAAAYNEACRSLKIMQAGITLGSRKGKTLIPDQRLALSTRLNRNAFATADVGYSEAIGYLRKETVTLPAGMPTGFTLLTYKHQPLGFVKNIGNRANNLYPAEWKIKSSHIPAEPCILRLGTPTE